MYRYSNGQISPSDFKQPVGMNLKESKPYTFCSGQNRQRESAFHPADRTWQGRKAGGIRSQAGRQHIQRMDKAGMLVIRCLQ